MALRFASLALAAGLCLSAAARAQIISVGGGSIVVSPDGSVMVMEVGDAPQAQPPDVAAAEGKPSATQTARLEQLKKLEFDRRPSAILAAWTEHLKTPVKPEEEKKPAAARPEAAKPAEATPDDPAAAKAKADAEAAKKKQEEEAATKAAEAKALEEEMRRFTRNVTLGEWAEVKSYLSGLSDDEKKAGYERLIQMLLKGPKNKPDVPQQGQAYLEKNRFAPEDVTALAAAAPLKLTNENLTTLGQILRQALDAGHQLESFLADVRPQLDEQGFAFDKRQLALMLVAASEPRALEGLLPTAKEAEEQNDREGLNLLSRYFLAQYDKDKKVTWLEQAWAVTQAVLAVGEVKEEAKVEALKRAVDIAPKIQKELGQAWLDESFAKRPERGMEILAAIGSSSSLSLAAEPMAEDKRFKLLELQTTAAKALLATAPERATEWSAELALLAGNWLREAQVTYQLDDSTALGPRMQRDNYGNFFWWENQSGNRHGNQPTPIRTDKILDIRPSDEWLSRIDATLQPRFHMIFAQLLLKVGEEAQAFPYIEQLAASLPKQAKDLVDEFLRVWTKNHNPNADQGRSNRYVYFFGFEERANGIPLTRSKQERNLLELGEWVARLRKLPVEMNDELLTGAFTTAHSTAEVYRLETIEQIFGPLAELEPATLAELVQKMRTNLVTVWRDAAVQKDKKTGRRQQDIQSEVLRGYQLADATIGRALADHAKSWELCLAKAALQHDENNYRHELKKDSEFSSRREAAFETFRRAAELYGEAVESLDQEKETTKVYETWFYAALGACDLGAIDQDKQLAGRQIPRIREALATLPGERAERHMGMFASTLFTRMSSAAPAVKFRYVREGLDIVGEHKLAREARQVYDYYKDLVTEIQLRATIDGSDRVGHGAPFGLRVDIRHTREIERESGGFSKYLQNQNSQNYAWNYGRPLEDYRDKFEEATREALKEHFEVLSVTFNAAEARSRAEPEYGWRTTPYVYLLLKPRGAQIDRVPPLRLDLDFLDTTGYAIIPVESPAVPIDATMDQGEERPYEKLALTQTLDERQAKEGKLLLEVKASAIGLAPALEEVLEFAPEGFDVVQRDDHGVSVVKFDEDSDRVASERTWTIAMRAKEGLAKLPTSFTFGKPRAEAAASEYFRYVDADLATVEPTISLERRYGRVSRAWMWWIPILVAASAAAFLVWRGRKQPKARVEGRFQVPEPLTPFTVLGLLRDIERNDGLALEERRELGAEIRTLEHHFFIEESREAPDLQRIAESWVGRAT